MFPQEVAMLLHGAFSPGEYSLQFEEVNEPNPAQWRSHTSAALIRVAWFAFWVSGVKHVYHERRATR